MVAADFVRRSSGSRPEPKAGPAPKKPAGKFEDMDDDIPF